MSVEMLSSPISEPAPAQPRPAKGDEIDLGAIVAAIKRRRGTILGLAVLCTSIGIGASYAVKPSYWAEAVVSLNVRGAAVTDNPSVVADLKVDSSIIRGEIDIITSRISAGRVVDALALKPEPVAEDDGALKERSSASWPLDRRIRPVRSGRRTDRPQRHRRLAAPDPGGAAGAGGARGQRPARRDDQHAAGQCQRQQRRPVLQHPHRLFRGVLRAGGPDRQRLSPKNTSKCSGTRKSARRSTPTNG